MSEGLLLCGKRGSGKSLSAVRKIQQYVDQGRTVATNLNLYPEKLASPRNRTVIHRLPDWPRVEDLQLLPLGNPNLAWGAGGDPEMRPGFREEQNGLLVLDEVATFLNSRDWQAKDRHLLINWLLQSRKFGWDLIFICQHPRLLDAQMRDSLFELYAQCRRLDKMAIPLVSRVFGIVGIKVRFPKMHLAVVKYGFAPTAPVSDTWLFSGGDLYQCYDTLQQINPAIGVDTGQGYSLLSAWHLRGRYLGFWAMHKAAIVSALLLGLLLGAFIAEGVHRFVKKAEPALLSRSSAPRVIGDLRAAGRWEAFLDNGKTVTVLGSRETAAGLEYEVAGGQWLRRLDR